MDPWEAGWTVSSPPGGVPSRTGGSARQRGLTSAATAALAAEDGAPYLTAWVNGRCPSTGWVASWGATTA